jgi:hypothetical protein
MDAKSLVPLVHAVSSRRHRATHWLSLALLALFAAGYRYSASLTGQLSRAKDRPSRAGAASAPVDQDAEWATVRPMTTRGRSLSVQADRAERERDVDAVLRRQGVREVHGERKRFITPCIF